MKKEEKNFRINDHFGVQRLAPTERDEQVSKFFEELAPTYDSFIDKMTLGFHRIWKEILIRRLTPTNKTKLIDVAAGTGDKYYNVFNAVIFKNRSVLGDVAFRFLNFVTTNNLEGCHVTVTDNNEAMLNLAIKRGEALQIDPSLISFKIADAEQLPFEANSFNACSIAYGLRNCTRVDKVLAEAYRVLQPGGKLICLESNYSENSFFFKCYFPLVGLFWQLLFDKREHYEYFVESMKNCASSGDFKMMIEEAGFEYVSCEVMFPPSSVMFMGYKL